MKIRPRAYKIYFHAQLKNCSNEYVHLRSIARAFAARIHQI